MAIVIKISEATEPDKQAVNGQLASEEQKNFAARATQSASISGLPESLKHLNNVKSNSGSGINSLFDILRQNPEITQAAFDELQFVELKKQIEMADQSSE